MKTVAIMQPTYLPWIGYFALMDKVDHFVLLDSVQFERRSWQQRNRIKSANGVQMLTVPVLKKGKHGQLIYDVELDLENRFRQKHINSIQCAYASAPFFLKYSERIFSALSTATPLLVDLTIGLILEVRDMLGISTEVSRSSQMDLFGTKADLLAEICCQLEADVYVSPPGSRVYMEQSTVFSGFGIDVIYHDYMHPEYMQLHGAFIPFMSSIDLLFNVGEESLQILRQA